MGPFWVFCSAPAEIPRTSIKRLCPWLSPAKFSFWNFTAGALSQWLAKQWLVHSTLLDGECNFKWLIYCSLSMWGVMENPCSIWDQRQMMLTLHCSVLIFMQMFPLHCVSIKPYTVSSIEVKFILSTGQVAARPLRVQKLPTPPLSSIQSWLID